MIPPPESVKIPPLNPPQSPLLHHSVFDFHGHYALELIDARGSEILVCNRWPTTFIYSGELTGVPLGDAPQLLATSYTITAEVEVPETGGDGMIATQGGRFGGWASIC